MPDVREELADITLATLTVSIVIFVAILVNDIVDYKDIADGSYKTPWHSRNWLMQPFTNLMVALHPSRVYETTNAIGDPWVVQETLIGDKAYWTVLNR